MTSFARAVFSVSTNSTALAAATFAQESTASLLMNTPVPEICRVQSSRYALKPRTSFPSQERSSRLVGSRTQIFLMAILGLLYDNMSQYFTPYRRVRMCVLKDDVKLSMERGRVHRRDE